MRDKILQRIQKLEELGYTIEFDYDIFFPFHLVYWYGEYLQKFGTQKEAIDYCIGRWFDQIVIRKEATG